MGDEDCFTDSKICGGNMDKELEKARVLKELEKKAGEQTKGIEIDPNELREGTCHIRKLGKGKVSICKESGKIKIFEVDKEE